jgi:hypothetical protein
VWEKSLKMSWFPVFVCGHSAAMTERGCRKVSMRKFIKIPHLAEAVGCTIPLSGRAKRKSWIIVLR